MSQHTSEGERLSSYLLDNTLGFWIVGRRGGHGIYPQVQELLELLSGQNENTELDRAALELAGRLPEICTSTFIDPFTAAPC